MGALRFRSPQRRLSVLLTCEGHCCSPVVSGRSRNTVVGPPGGLPPVQTVHSGDFFLVTSNGLLLFGFSADGGGDVEVSCLDGFIGLNVLLPKKSAVLFSLPMVREQLLM